ncbi:rod shape-determining protein MreC [Lentiprolixibacter aurantiacus]|uniref:Cell shape-determining protein MreC n=1 Tax=Lentiprolixibacter aurantiacus TaxID=2993939 RepID=A0AAE3SMA2_9FLAO|nr:rod shape-determining protein MreC [Lentiprolixibacter aurantiacus]MCX2718066.1 rod shape-determining protein MreC [Lentiprolixibacter aurantiacus]
MQQIINFLIRNKTTLLYLLLLFISLLLTIQSHSFHQSKFFNSANRVSGNIFQTASNISSYFSLRAENKSLREDIEKLRNQLFNLTYLDSLEMDTTNLQYRISVGRVIKNSYSNQKNYLTINLGSKQGIVQDMGVITAKGILGIVEASSNNYAIVQSILNTNSNINAKIKNTSYFGSLTWDGNDFTTVQLEDIPRLVPLMVGDTIVTGAMSSIFPENIPIGVIKKFDLNTSQSFYSIDVALFNDMTNIRNVYLIENLDRAEILELQNSIEDGQE